MRTAKPTYSFDKNRATPHCIRMRRDKKYVAKYFATKEEADAYTIELNKEIMAEERPFTAEERSWVRLIKTGAEACGVLPQDVSVWLLDLIQKKKEEVKAAPLVPGDDIAEAVEKFLSEKDVSNLRDRSMEGYRRNLRRFAKEMPVSRVGQLNRQILITWITGRYKNEASRNTLKNNLTPFLSSCAEKGWISREVFLKLKWQKVHADEKSLVWATPEIVTRMMNAAPPVLQPALACGAFGGIRPYECQRIEWEMFDFQKRIVDIPGWATKTRKDRILYKLPETMWAWLEKVPAEKRCGKVFPMSRSSWNRYFARTVKGSGIGLWPTDGLRKGFATHGSRTNGRDWTKDNMGHANERLLDAVYRGAIDKDTADEYFQLVPEKVNELTKFPRKPLKKKK